MAATKEHISIVISGHVDSGKCIGFDTPVLMADSTTKMVQNIVPGDKVMGTDSRPCTVKLTTTGQDEMYDVIPTFGIQYTVTQDHYLVLKATNYKIVNWDVENQYYDVTWLDNFVINRKIFSVSQYGTRDKALEIVNNLVEKELPENHVGYTRPGDLVEIKAVDFYKLPIKTQEMYESYSTGIKFPTKEVKVDPYVLGYWLGKNDNSPSFKTEDPEVSVFLTSTVGRELGLSPVAVYSNNTFIVHNNLEVGSKTVWRDFLLDHENSLNTIPTNYKLNSKENRLKLLAGFIDSCGSYMNQCYQVYRKYDELSKDVVFLARSLGFYVNCLISDDSICNITIHGEELNKLPILVTRKKPIYNVIVTNRVTLVPAGNETYYGFQLEENPRFLLGDFTVTHNSTTTGHLIFELGGISERDMQKLRDEAARLGKSSFSFAFFMDTTKEERERGVTIQCTTKEFFTERYHLSCVDSPGHRDFIKNMISGASQADVGLLMVPADGGFTVSIAKGNHKEGEVQGQTRQHARLLNLLGIKQLIIGINKMDSDIAGYKEERYKEIRDEMILMLQRVGWPKQFVETSVAFLPISGWKGDNLLKKSENMPWWNGVDVKATDGTTVHVTTIYDALDKLIQVPKRPVEKNLVCPISGVHKIKGVGDVLTSRIEMGVAKPGMEVMFLPTHTAANACTGKIFSIEMHHRSIPEAPCGNNVGFSIKGLNKDNMPKIGDVMVLKNDATFKVPKRFTTQVQILDHPGELKLGYTPVIFSRTGRAACKMVEIKWKMGKETGNAKVDNPPFVKQNEAAEIVWEPQQPFMVTPFDICEGLSRCAIMDGGSVVMIAKVTGIEA